MAKLKLTLPRPTPKQKIFLSARHRYVAFGGARGGGKSFAVRLKAVLLCLAHPGIKIMIIRRTYPELQANHIKPFKELLPKGSYRYHESKKELTFGCGSVILFRYCANIQDVDKFQGTECDVMFIDEATQFTEEQYKRLSACVRGVNSFPKRIYLTCNPGGRGHSWVKRLFIDRKYESGESGEDFFFIKSLVTDNKALMKSDPDYIKELESLPPKLRKAWLEGSWDIFEGQFFEDFRETPDLMECSRAGITPEEAKKTGRWCHVIEPFDLNAGERRGWRILRSYDFGYNKPFSLAYWALDYDGVLYRILELYGCNGTPNEGVKWTPDEQFRKIVQLESEHPWLKGRKIYDSIADPAIWDSSRGDSIADTAAKYGLYFSPGDNKRIPGWMQVHYRLQFDENGYARMYVFDTCKAFIRTIPQLVYSETNPEDLDTSMEDHVADEVRYICMSRPVAPILREPERIILSDPLNQFTNKNKRY